jgi:hypothetical protein
MNRIIGGTIPITTGIIITTPLLTILMNLMNLKL